MLKEKILSEQIRFLENQGVISDALHTKVMTLGLKRKENIIYQQDKVKSLAIGIQV